MITAYEENVELVSDVLDRNRCDLTNHGVEGEAGHCRDGDTLRARTSVEDLGRYNPR